MGHLPRLPSAWGKPQVWRCSCAEQSPASVSFSLACWHQSIWTGCQTFSRSAWLQNKELQFLIVTLFIASPQIPTRTSHQINESTHTRPRPRKAVQQEILEESRSQVCMCWRGTQAFQAQLHHFHLRQEISARREIWLP